ncbi:Ku protein [Streptomyces sp. NPDC090306]|uniref:non-homologous end joining protein Ku n=1 Tax=unclassified Streptomyces TaxID=2593676 RepID=UPI0036E213E7
MPRSIWSGAISFGLVTVPVNVVSASEDHSIRFHRIHVEDGGRVRTRKICEIEDREVSNEEIGKGYEVAPDQVVPVTDQELQNLPLPTAHSIEIQAFVPLAGIDPIRIGDGYYLQPHGDVATKPYALLRQALGRSARVAVAKYAWSGRERLGLLRVRDDVLVLHAMRWDDEIRSPAELAPGAVDVSDAEVDEAVHLIDRLSRDGLEGDDLRDTYTEALHELIEAKREGAALPETPEPAEQSGRVLDLMAALQQSVDAAKKSRGEDTGDADVHPMPKKKTAAKRQPAKRAAAKKATTKKAAAKKSGTAKRTKRSA